MATHFNVRPLPGEYDDLFCYSEEISEKGCSGEQMVVQCLDQDALDDPYKDDPRYIYLGEYVENVHCMDESHHQFLKAIQHNLYYKLVTSDSPEDPNPDEPSPMEPDPRGTQPPLVKKYFFKKQKNTNQASIDFGGHPAFRWIAVPEQDSTCNKCDVTWNTPTGNIQLRFKNSTTSEEVPFTIKSPTPFVPQNGYFTELPDWVADYKITSTGVTFTVIPSRLSSDSAVFAKEIKFNILSDECSFSKPVNLGITVQVTEQGYEKYDVQAEATDTYLFNRVDVHLDQNKTISLMQDLPITFNAPSWITISKNKTPLPRQLVILGTGQIGEAGVPAYSMSISENTGDFRTANITYNYKLDGKTRTSKNPIVVNQGRPVDE